MALHYQITVKGILDASWSAWFDGLTITHDVDGNTRLTGAIRDQTALYGLIDKARDLALTLVAVVELSTDHEFVHTKREHLERRAMKAIVYTHYGSPDELQFKEVAQPTPKDTEVLIKVHAAAVNAGDWHLLRGQPFLMRLGTGLRKPKHPILGADVAGKVVAVGPNVTRFQAGDEVFGDLSNAGYGGFAEYVAAEESAFVMKPANVTFEQAAAVLSAAVTALQGLRDEGQMQPGQQVLVNGASGGVGSFAVQIAKALGAEVTGVCSTRNVEMVRGLGADHVIDYTQQDFTQNGRQYDLILDAAAHRPLTDFKPALTAQGRYVMVGGSTQRYFQMMVMGPWLSQKGGQHFGTFLKAAKPKDLAFLKDLVDAGKVAPIIDRRYPLPEVAEAIRYVEAGHTHGKVVITVT